MSLRSHITPLAKLLSALSYLGLLLFSSAFTGYTGYMPSQPAEPLCTEIFFSVEEPTVSASPWKLAVAALRQNAITNKDSKHQLPLLSRAYDRLSRVFYDHIARRFVLSQPLICVAPQKIISPGSDELPPLLSIL